MFEVGKVAGQRKTQLSMTFVRDEFKLLSILWEVNAYQHKKRTASLFVKKQSVVVFHFTALDTAEAILRVLESRSLQ